LTLFSVTYACVSPVKLYTYGQPRTGNTMYAQWINDKIGRDKCFRVVNNLDGVVTTNPLKAKDKPQDDGVVTRNPPKAKDKPQDDYMHHGTEYWTLLPHSSAQTRKCDGDFPKEDSHGSGKYESHVLNPSHFQYFDITYFTPFLSPPSEVASTPPPPEVMSTKKFGPHIRLRGLPSPADIDQ